ncbi:MAG: GIY-YIG nuclease family protein [Gammaproteobacteria bacterium]|nr:GIY-YIG nuclease family protein [Gammaproteobacteria bacterium]
MIIPRTYGKYWYVYLLRCSDGSLYCGISNRLFYRIDQHNKGKGAKYTRSRLPVKLVWCRLVGSKSSALKEESRIKGLSRSQKLSLIKGLVLCTVESYEREDDSLEM